MLMLMVVMLATMVRTAMPSGHARRTVTPPRAPNP